MTWLKEGDNNTKFFHAVVQYNRKRSLITKINDEQGNSYTDPEDIKRHALHYYQTLFSTENTRVSEELLAYIPSLVTEEDNNILLSTPSDQEMKILLLVGW